MSNPRVRRIADRIKVTVAEMLERRIKDPRLGFVTVTDARVTNDLAHATVFYSVLAGEDAHEAHEGLQSAAGRIQAALGAQTRLKRTPRLRFEPDPVVENVGRIEAALRDVKERGEDAGTHDDV